MSKPKRKPNNFRIHSEKLNKLFWWFFSIMAIFDATILLILFADFISECISGKGHGISAAFEGYYPFMDFLMLGLILSFMAFAIVVLYNYMMNLDKYHEAKIKAESESPLTDAAKGHEQQVIDLMISVIKPIPGKKTIPQAKTAKFIKALKDMNLMNVNLEGQHLIPWIETVSGFSAGNTSHFNQALDAVKIDDDEVPKFKAQLEQILAS